MGWAALSGLSSSCTSCRGEEGAGGSWGLAAGKMKGLVHALELSNKDACTSRANAQGCLQPARTGRVGTIPQPVSRSGSA